MIGMFFWLTLGAALACAAGLTTGFYIQRRDAKKLRTNLAKSLSDELRTSADLYNDVKAHWEKEKFILFVHLDEIEHSRYDYQNARPYLPNIPDQNLRSRLSNYYRKSAIVLDKLRSFENDRARLKELLEQAPRELEKVKGTDNEQPMSAAIAARTEDLTSVIKRIDAMIDEIEEHRLNALAMADKLEHI